MFVRQDILITGALRFQASLVSKALPDTFCNFQGLCQEDNALGHIPNAAESNKEDGDSSLC